MNVREGFLDRFGDDVAGLVNIAQPVRLVEHDQIPVDALDVGSLGLGKLVRANDRPRLWQTGHQEGVLVFLLADRVVIFGLKNQALQIEFVLQFLVPLLAQVSGDDDQ